MPGLKTLHLFAGAGAGLLADLILGHEPIAAVEWDPYCCAVLRERAEDGWFPGLRVHEGDIREFDASEYKGRVDCLHAGFPCQPFSVAGKQLGADDKRDMWPATLSVIRVVRPEWIMLENVPGLVAWNDGERVADIIGSLAGLGYVGSHGVLGADDVGAAHIRKRWWCVANNPSIGRRTGRQRGSDSIDPWQPKQPLQNMADPESLGRRLQLSTRHEKEGPALIGSGKAMADAGRGMPRHGHNGTQPAFWSGKTSAPRSRGAVPDADQRRTEPELGRVANGLADGPHAPNWWLEEPEGIPRVAQCVDARVHRLKALGNGQVPLQTATAWMILTQDRLA